MKKRLLTLSLVAAMAATLTGCDTGYNYEDGIMVYVNGKAYTTDELFAQYGLNTSEGVKAYYDALSNIVAEATVEKTQNMINDVNDQLDTFYSNAESAASTNGTSEKEEIENALDSEGVDSVEELEAKYYLQAKKAKAEDDFRTDSRYTSTYIPEFVSEKAPYHVRHILVNIDAGAADIYNGTISEDDARDLSNVVTRLVEGESFGSVAQSKSEDTGSAAVFGDVGIMDLETSFVNEFKLNLYTYDAYFNPEVSDKQNVIDTTFTSDTTLQEQYETLLGGKVFGIPYSAVVAMDYYADKTRSDTGVEVTDATAVNYPRNVLFNNYFNNHSLSFIYLDDVSEAIKDNHSSEYYTQDVYDAANASTNFQTVDGISTNLKTYTEEGDNHATGVTNISGSHKILCDENGNPILVARAGTGTTSSDSEDDSSSGYQGVHFIIVQKNPFTDIEGEYETKEAELEHYYNLDIPSTTTSDGQGSGETYISFINSTDRDNYQERATAIKTEIDNVYSSEFTYRLFNEQLAAAESGNNANDVKITVNEDIKSAITSYIDTELYNNALTETETYENSWKSFIRLLEVANTYSKRIIPLSGIDAFNKNQITEYNNVRAGESAGN